MADKKRETIDQRPRHGWERPIPTDHDSAKEQTTFRADGPSPIEEVLAKHEAEIGEGEVEPLVEVRASDNGVYTF